MNERRNSASDPPGSVESTFRFYAELNEFLPPDRRRRSFPHSFDGTPSVKDRIEALGVPHSEVDLVLIDGNPAAFDERLQGGERVAVYPAFETFDVSGISKVQPGPLSDPRFILDVHLGRLAGYLRALGFDSLYANDYSDNHIITTALDEHRIIVTRDTGILKDGRVTQGCFVHATEPLAQLREVVDRFRLDALVAAFSRCIKCNGRIEPIDKDSVAGSLDGSTNDRAADSTADSDGRGQVPAGVIEDFDSFTRCSGCRRIYWPGSHFDRLRERFRSVGIEI